MKEGVVVKSAGKASSSGLTNWGGCDTKHRNTPLGGYSDSFVGVLEKWGKYYGKQPWLVNMGQKVPDAASWVAFSYLSRCDVYYFPVVGLSGFSPSKIRHTGVYS